MIRIATLEFRKRIYWYAKTMHPCRFLKDPMHEINSAQDFEEALTRFLDWRLRYDQQLAAGKIKPIPTDEALAA